MSHILRSDKPPLLQSAFHLNSWRIADKQRRRNFSANHHQGPNKIRSLAQGQEAAGTDT